MKSTFYFLLVLLTISACKKEATDIKDKDDDKNNPPYSPFAANDSLISANASVYIIADVQGLPGITKMNKQDTVWSVTPGWGAGVCYTGYSSYDGSVGNAYALDNWHLYVFYKGKGETREQLLVSDHTKLAKTANDEYGVAIAYKSLDGKTYYSYLSDNAALSWANVKLVERAAVPNTQRFYVKLNLNCELTNENNPSDKISFKNAVVRVQM